MSTPHLTYDLPSYVTAGKTQPIRIQCTNPPNGQAFTVNTVTVKMTCGTGEGDLTTATDTDALTLTLPDTLDWATTTPLSDNNTLEAGIQHTGDGYLLTPGAALEWYLNVPVSATEGTAQLTVRENNTDDKTLSLPKAKAGFFFGELEPQLFAVRAGESTTLSWTATPAGYGLKSVLSYSTADGAGDHQSINEGTYTSKPFTLTQSTSFRLDTTVTPPPGHGSPFTIPLNTFVTVIRPDLAATLITADRAPLLQQPFNGGGRLADYPFLWRTTPINQTFHTETDGLLYITTQGNTANVSLAVDLIQNNSTIHILKLLSRTERNSLLPIPHNYSVRIQAECTGKYLLALNWQPFGIGPLRPTLTQ
ncbi:hypothetical protein ACWIG3_32220 [Streptomyces celluloflavus]